jgi:hypothetical protein
MIIKSYYRPNELALAMVIEKLNALPDDRRQMALNIMRLAQYNGRRFVARPNNIADVVLEEREHVLGLIRAAYDDRGMNIEWDDIESMGFSGLPAMLLNFVGTEIAWWWLQYEAQCWSEAEYEEAQWAKGAGREPSGSHSAQAHQLISKGIEEIHK